MTWLGDTLSDAFIKLWRKLWHTWDKDGDGGAFGKFTGAMLPEYFPFEQIEHCLRNASVRFNDATWSLVGGFGRKIGDKTIGKIDEGINKAIAEAKAKIDETKRYLEDNLIAPINRKTDEMKAKLKQLGINVDSLEIDVGKALSDVSNMKTSISKFQSDIDAFGSKLNSFDGKLGDLSSKANSIESLIDDVNSKIAEINGRVKILEEKERIKLPSIFKS